MCEVQVAVVASHYEQLSFGKAIDAIQKVSARGNLFLQEKEPWSAFKKVRLPLLLFLVLWTFRMCSQSCICSQALYLSCKCT